MVKKENYQGTQMEIVEFTVQDMITTSPGGGGGLILPDDDDIY